MANKGTGTAQETRMASGGGGFCFYCFFPIIAYVATEPFHGHGHGPDSNLLALPLFLAKLSRALHLRST